MPGVLAPVPRDEGWTRVLVATVAFLLDPTGVESRDRISVSLGHTGFFRYFHTSFDFQRGRVKIRPNGLFVGRRN